VDSTLGGSGCEEKTPGGHHPAIAPCKIGGAAWGNKRGKANGGESQPVHGLYFLQLSIKPLSTHWTEPQQWLTLLHLQWKFAERASQFAPFIKELLNGRGHLVYS
jgi:hypothetical protein